MKSLVFCAFALSIIAGGEARAANPVAQVAGGKAEGRQLAASGAVFKGIPFAAPPVGDLRWREPQPVKAWTGLRDASAFGASCVQNISGWNAQEATGNKEDCLYLNVWTPQFKAGAKVPVMVWVHGGGNTGGGASVDYFDGASLASKGVVLVTLNYRLGVMGFMAHPGLTAESAHKASGNYGLLDQVAALKWVKANIAQFGGDPDNVTIFGQSAGAGDIAYLLASPLTKGLITRAIQESSGGGARPAASLREAEKAGERFAASLKAPAGAAGLAYLRGLPADQVQKAASAAGGDRPTIAPSVDGWFMPVLPRETFAAGKQLSVPLLVGTVAQEQNGPKPEDLRREVTEAYGVNAQKALAYYGLAGDGPGNSDPLYGPAILQVAADTDQRCGSFQQAVWHADARNVVYQYQFDRTIPGRPRPQHSGEVPYVFGNLLKDGFLGGPYGEADRKISGDIQGYWTNFAKTGNPNGTGLPAWPRFESGARPYLEFTDNGPVAKANLRREICDLFSSNLLAQMRGTK